MYKLASLLLLVTVFVALPVGAQDAPAAAEKPEPLWTGNAALSFVSTSGNTKTTSLGLDFSFVRRPTPWGLEIFGLYNRAEDSGTLTAERSLLGVKGTRSLNDRWDVFAGLSGEKDVFSGFERRTLLEAGVGYKAVSTDRLSLHLAAGATYTDENRVAPEPDARFAGAVASADLAWQISESAALTESLNYYPNFKTSNDWRMESTTAIEATLTDLLGLRLSYEYRHRNLPIDGNDSTDTTTKAALVVKF